VTLHVAVQQSLKGERLGTQAALELGGIRFRSGRRKFLVPGWFHRITGQRIFNAVTSIDDFQRSVWWQAKLK
jgi:hypothetical protein